MLYARVDVSGSYKGQARLRASQERHLDRRTRIEQELSAVEARLGRLMEALLRGGSLETVVAQIKVEEQRKRVLRTELEGLVSAARVAVLDASQIKRDLAERACDIRALLGRHTRQARQALRTVLEGQIVMEPIVEDARRGYRLSGRLNVGRLLRGEVFRLLGQDERNSPSVVAPTGFQPVFPHRRALLAANQRLAACW